MRERIGIATCAALALGTTITLLAQDPSRQTPQTRATGQTAEKSITVTGCVQRAEAGSTGTSGTSGTSAAAATKFVLTNASLSSSGTTGTSGATTPPATAISSEYRLDTDEAKLSPHVGHKVEITGMVEPPSRTEQKPPASAANAPTLKVDNVKMVATTCP